MAGPSKPWSGGNRVRRTLSALLVVLTGLFALMAVVVVHVDANLLTTDRYVELTTPLADHPDVKDALAETVSTTVVDRVRLDQVTQQGLDSLRSPDTVLGRLLLGLGTTRIGVEDLLANLGPALQNQFEEAVRRQVGRAVDSERFDQVWIDANRAGHERVVQALRGGDPAGGSPQGGVALDLAPVVETVKERLVDSGFGAATSVPSADTSLVLVDSGALAQARPVIAAVDRLAPWAPWLFVVTSLGAVVLMPRRERSVLPLTAALASAMLVGMLLLALARSWLVERAGAVEPAAAAAYFDAVNAPLNVALDTVLVIAVFVGAIGVVLDLRTLYARTLARTLVLLGAGLTIALWVRPDAGQILSVVVAAAALLLVIELVLRIWPRAAAAPLPP